MKIKNISDIPFVNSGHGTGVKQVLLSKEDTDTNITQVAVVTMKQGDSGDTHVHWGIEESFFVISGELNLISGEQIHLMKEGDFVRLQMGTKHNLEAITDVKLLSIGCKL